MLSLRTVLILFLSLGVFNIFSAHGQFTLPREEYDELMNIKTRYLLLQQDSIKLVEQLKANKALQETLDIAKSQLQNLAKLETANQEQKTSLEKLTKENADLKKENESYDGFKKERKDLTSQIKELEKKEALLNETLAAKSQVVKDLANKTTQLNKLELEKSEYAKNDSLLKEIKRFKTEGDLMARENIAKNMSELKKAITIAKADALLQNISKNLVINQKLNPEGYATYLSELAIPSQILNGLATIELNAQKILTSPYNHNGIEEILPVLQSCKLIVPNLVVLKEREGLLANYCKMYIETYDVMYMILEYKKEGDLSKNEKDMDKVFEEGMNNMSKYPYLLQKLGEFRDEKSSLLESKYKMKAITLDKPERGCVNIK